MAQSAKTFWYSLQGPYQGMAEKVFADAIAMACSFWSRACGVTFERSFNHGDPVNITFMQGQLYPPTAELGTCSGHGEHRTIVLYCSPHWAFGKVPDGCFDAVRIIAHEIGHVILGDDHLPAGNIMAGGYNLQSRTPAAGDIKLAQAKYGPPLNLKVGVAV